MSTEFFQTITIIISVVAVVACIICSIYAARKSEVRDFKVEKLSNSDHTLSSAIKYLKITNASEEQSLGK